MEADATGKLVYGAANICNHFFTTEYLEKVTDDALTFHVAKKAIPYAGEDGKTIKPEKKDKNGVKRRVVGGCHLVFYTSIRGRGHAGLYLCSMFSPISPFSLSLPFPTP